MRRSYQQFCGLARALDVVGERWTLLVVRNLLLGPKRYGDLMAQLPGITTNLLAKRLSEMEEAGIVERRVLPAPARVPVYALTDGGRALEPAIMELARWGGRFMDAPRPDDAIDVGWGLLSLKRRYLGGMHGTVELTADDRSFVLAFAESYLGVEERSADAPDARLSGALPLVRGLFSGPPPSIERARELGLRIEGDPGVLERCLGAIAAAPTPPSSAPAPNAARRSSDRSTRGGGTRTAASTATGARRAGPKRSGAGTGPTRDRRRGG